MRAQKTVATRRDDDGTLYVYVLKRLGNRFSCYCRMRVYASWGRPHTRLVYHLTHFAFGPLACYIFVLAHLRHAMRQEIIFMFFCMFKIRMSGWFFFYCVKYMYLYMKEKWVVVVVQRTKKIHDKHTLLTFRNFFMSFIVYLHARTYTCRWWSWWWWWYEPLLQK